MENKENDELSDLIGNSRYIPFLHRLKEGYLSIGVKWVINFIFAVFQTLNVPAVVMLLLFFIEQVVQKITGESKFSFLPYNYVTIASIFGGWILLQFLWDKTVRNIVSPTIFPIWFMTTKGQFKNDFFSAELSRKYSADLDQFVQYQADEYIKEKLHEKDRQISNLIDALEQLRQLSAFPNESFESMKRVIEYMADSIIEPNNSRHQIEAVMDRILVEIASTKPIHTYIKQGSIMLVNEAFTEFEIYGQYNISNSVVKRKKVKLGEKFAGKVASDGEIVWINDVNTPEAEDEYGFSPDSNRPYGGIMGFPIRESGDEAYYAIGVIILHFQKGYHLDEEQKQAVAKVLEVYSQAIISTIKLQNYRMHLRDEYSIIDEDNEISSVLIRR